MKDKPLIKYEELTDEQKAWVKDYINDDRPDEEVFETYSDEQRAFIEEYWLRGGVDGK